MQKGQRQSNVGMIKERRSGFPRKGNTVGLERFSDSHKSSVFAGDYGNVARLYGSAVSLFFKTKQPLDFGGNVHRFGMK